jgi:predicted nucleotidyltransferase component of viral defense system
MILPREDKEFFINLFEKVRKEKDFLPALIEKDYYLTLLLSKTKELCPNFAFKGGTCLNKIYFDYHRLSEDLDFTMILPHAKMTRKDRSSLMKPVKEKMESFLKQIDMRAEDINKSRHNESTLYIFKLIYNSVITNKEETIKLDVNLSRSPIAPTEEKEIKHKFYDQFGNELLSAGKITTLSLKELIAEKTRAAATRETIAPRDFYDLDYAIRNNFDFKNEEFAILLKNKFAEENFDTDLKKYALNLGRKNEEIESMKENIHEELYPVLTRVEKAAYDVNMALNRINNMIRVVIDIDKGQI